MVYQYAKRYQILSQSFWDIDAKSGAPPNQETAFMAYTAAMQWVQPEYRFWLGPTVPKSALWKVDCR